jgi:putative N6-adenine-specific DNA methylase
MEKRVKRHIKASSHEFFAATQPGLEHLCLKELAGLGLAGPDARILAGGVAFSGKLPDLYKAALFMHTPNRLLMRIGAFTATDFGSLSAKVAAIAWELYLPESLPINIRVSCRKSRLYHSDAVAQRVREAIFERMASIRPDWGKPDEKSGVQEIFVRLQSDRFTVSIDASGELMHKRGATAGKAKAPLRETLAASILHLSNWHPGLPLADPLCGSGSFSVEAAFWAKRVPPGAMRDFSFFCWPAFSKKTWEHLKKMAKEQESLFSSPVIFASDKDGPACQALAERLKALNLDDAASVTKKDFFALTPPCGQPGLVVINPPYGRRLMDEKKAKDLFERICKRLATHWQGWQFALLVPQKSWLALAPPGQIKPAILHGGLRIIPVVGRVE